MRKIFQLILAACIIALIYVVYLQISKPIKFEEECAQTEALVIERIQNIRSAQRSYKSVNQRFTADFDTLIQFVLNDSLKMERKIYDEDDSVGMAILKRDKRKNVEEFYVPVIDTVFSPRKLTPEQVLNLRYIPGCEGEQEYLLQAGVITTESKVVIPVVECRAPYIFYLDTVAYRQEIVNLTDNAINNFNRYPGIKFGSMEVGNNEAGNWE
ncbi:MAG: hypothetical protein SNJ33_06880 [Rikenellaceae bacterium]